MSKETISTRSGSLNFNFGIPTAETASHLYDEIDYQRACQAYIWAIPGVATSGWRKANHFYGGTGDCDLVSYKDPSAVAGILTPNSTVAYIMAFPNLNLTGPVVWKIPSGLISGGVATVWQQPVSDVGLTGPDQGQGAKYLIVGPGQDAPEDVDGYRVMHVPSNLPMVGLRILSPNIDEQKVLFSQISLYPYSERNAPSKQKRIWAQGETFYQAQPSGMAYWNRVNEIIQHEAVAERDRFFMAMLRPLGIEKGKPFKPDERQTRLLLEGARVGEAMAQTNTFFKRITESAFGSTRYRDDSNWEFVVLLNPMSQRSDSYDQLDERASLFYEAIGASEAVLSMTPGKGAAYFSQYTDTEGRAYDGSSTYKLRVPSNPPAVQFWELTCYDIKTRAFLTNGSNSGVGSNTPGLVTNDDGRVEIYIGPEEPKGFEANWIKTVPGRAWFAYFRLFGPTEPFFDRQFPLPDFEHIN